MLRREQIQTMQLVKKCRFFKKVDTKTVSTILKKKKI